jgi:putative membrane protein
MASFVVHWIALGIALWLTSSIVPGVSFISWQALAIGAFVLGLVNAFVRPVLTFLTFPLTLLTLGLFYFVVNGAAFGLAAAIVPGFQVASFLSAIVGAFVTGLVAWIVGAVLTPGPASRVVVRKG